MIVASRYNFFLPEVEGGSILFNTFSGRSLRLDDSRSREYQRLAEGETAASADLANFLSGLGFLVDDSVDEVERVKDRYLSSINENKQVSITVSLTEACNLRCSYCYQGHAVDNHDRNVGDALLGVVSQSLESGATAIHVNWFGGEPILKFKQLAEHASAIAEACRKWEVPFTQNVTSNGVLITSDIAAKLVSLGVRDVQITIDGNAEHHNRTRPRKGGSASYEQVLAGCREVLKSGMQLILRINVSRQCGDDVDQLLDDLATIGADDNNTTLHAVRALDHSSKEESSDKYFTNREFAETWIRILKKAALRGFAIPHLQPLPYNCSFDNGKTFFIDFSGKVGGCSSVPTISAADSPAVAVGNGPRNPTYFESYCRSCKFLPTCMGGCQYLEERGREKCAPEKYVFEQLIRMHFGSEERERAQ